MIIFKDTMKISRIVRVEDSNGIKKNVPTLLYSDIPCHLSIKNVNPVNVENEVVGTPSSFTIFCKGDVDILKGDIIECREFKFIVSVPKLMKILKKYEIGLEEWKD